MDREDAQSIVQKGPLRGITLHELWTSRRGEIFGAAYESHAAERFPILIKLLDARERLSVQVHPPVHMSQALGGERPKRKCGNSPTPNRALQFTSASNAALLGSNSKRCFARAESKRHFTSSLLRPVIASLLQADGSTRSGQAA